MSSYDVIVIGARCAGATNELLARALTDGLSGRRRTADALACGDREVPLTPTEFRLLAALTAQPDAVLRRRDLVRAAWPAGAIVRDNTLDQYVSRLRRKLRTLAAQVRITTVHGVGYRLH